MASTRDTEQDPAARERVDRLLAPDVAGEWSPQGYLDTLGGETTPPGRAQSAWQSELGSALYGRVLQPAARMTLAAPAFDRVPRRLRLTPGQTVADIGCGPGNVTVGLADAVGADGFVVGVDISAPMLAQAADGAAPNIGYVRGDATRLPLRTGCVDAACATALLMLIPEPEAALAELVRITTPGGRLLVIVPTHPNGLAAPLTRPLFDRMFGFAGARAYTPDDLADLVESQGCDRIHTDQQGVMLTITARTPLRTP